MQRNYAIYLQDILNSIHEIKTYTIDIRSFHEYLLDKKTLRAVERNLEIIGEAVKKLPDSFKMQTPDIEWRKIAGLRDMLIHGYSEIDDEMIWEIIQTKIPELESVIIRLTTE